MPRKKTAEGDGDDLPKAPHRQSVEYAAILGAAHQQSQSQQTQTKVDLNKGTREKYPAVLDILCKLFPFNTVKTGGDRRVGQPDTWWTQGKSAVFLPTAVPNLYDQAIEHPRKFGVNVCNPILVGLLGPTGQMPSGTQRDDLLQAVKEKIWDSVLAGAGGESEDAPEVSVDLTVYDAKRQEESQEVQSTAVTDITAITAVSAVLQQHTDPLPIPNVGAQQVSWSFSSAADFALIEASHSGTQPPPSTKGKRSAKSSEPSNWGEAFYKQVPKFWAWEHYGPFAGDRCISWFSLADGRSGVPEGPSRAAQREALLASKMLAASVKRETLASCVTPDGHGRSPAASSATRPLKTHTSLAILDEHETKAHKRQKLDLALRMRKDRIEELKLLLSFKSNPQEKLEVEKELEKLITDPQPTMEGMTSPPKPSSTGKAKLTIAESTDPPDS